MCRRIAKHKKTQHYAGLFLLMFSGDGSHQHRHCLCAGLASQAIYQPHSCLRGLPRLDRGNKQPSLAACLVVQHDGCVLDVRYVVISWSFSYKCLCTVNQHKKTQHYTGYEYSTKRYALVLYPSLFNLWVSHRAERPSALIGSHVRWVSFDTSLDFSKASDAREDLEPRW
jgi:hypothetical protein